MSYIEGGNEGVEDVPADPAADHGAECAPGTEDVVGKTMELSLGAGCRSPRERAEPEAGGGGLRAGISLWRWWGSRAWRRRSSRGSTGGC